MKYIRYIFWLFAMLVLLVWLAHHASPHAEQCTQAPEAVLLPPADYPEGFEEQLAAAPGIKISLCSVESLPSELSWQKGSEAPPVGSPEAIKGGTLRLSNVGPFPANFLAFGSPTPQFFHYNLFERIDIPLVWAHPSTGQEMAGLAEAWCVQGNSVFFRLNPNARYSNGRPVRARDFALGTLLRLRTGTTLTIKELRIYGDEVVEAVAAPVGIEPTLNISRQLWPAEPGFYAEFGSNYAEHYAQRIPPTTGAYTVERVQRGRLIVLQKVPQWWAAELPGFRYTHNPDHIEHHFLTDEAQVWEQFFAGRLELIQTRNVTAWHSKPEGVPAAEDGRIVLHSLRIDTPMPPYGIALNTSRLTDTELRRGLMQAMDMDRAIDILFRGYAGRLPQFATGYHNLRHSTEQYRYSPEEARACFARAGYTESGPDGILRKADGTRLSVRFSFSPSDKLNLLATLLCQSAAACGAEIIPEPLPWQLLSEQLKNGTHEMTFWATMPGYLLPDYSVFHSQAEQSPFRLRSQEADAAIVALQNAETREQAEEACARMDKLIFQEAIWLPGWMENRANIAAWRHVRIPSHYAGPYEVAESHQLWISPQ